ncbi:integrase core domain-containing protein [Thermobifida halotolerans]
MAAGNREQHIGRSVDGLVHHSGRGVRYLAVRSTQRLAEARAVVSVESTGDSYDNALAEALHSLFKAEPVRNRGPWKNIDDLELAVAEYIDWFNHRRLHGEIGLVPPAESETDFYQHNPASVSVDALVPSLQKPGTKHLVADAEFGRHLGEPAPLQPGGADQLRLKAGDHARGHGRVQHLVGMAFCDRRADPRLHGLPLRLGPLHLGPAGAQRGPLCPAAQVPGQPRVPQVDVAHRLHEPQQCRRLDLGHSLGVQAPRRPAGHRPQPRHAQPDRAHHPVGRDPGRADHPPPHLIAQPLLGGARHQHVADFHQSVAAVLQPVETAAVHAQHIGHQPQELPLGHPQRSSTEPHHRPPWSNIQKRTPTREGGPANTRRAAGSRTAGRPRSGRCHSVGTGEGKRGQERHRRSPRQRD